jgi:hypothetical protein
MRDDLRPIRPLGANRSGSASARTAYRRNTFTYSQHRRYTRILNTHLPSPNRRGESMSRFTRSRFAVVWIAGRGGRARGSRPAPKPGATKHHADGDRGPIKDRTCGRPERPAELAGRLGAQGCEARHRRVEQERGHQRSDRSSLGVFDDQGDPTTGPRWPRKIASENYIAMIGTAESAVTIRHGRRSFATRHSRTSPPVSPPSGRR